MASTAMNMNDQRSTEVIVIAWVFTGIATATVAMKIFARAHITKQLGWDDFFIFFSMALSIIAASFVHYSATLGLGKHTALVAEKYGPEVLVKTAYWQILGYPFNIGAFSFPNISIAILINKLLYPSRWRPWALYSMVILQVVIAMISVFIVFFQCSPTQALWNPAVNGKCWKPSVLNNFSYFLSAYTTMTDFVLAIVPISAFWKLQMRFSTKIGLCIMVGLTMLSAIVTLIKATYLHLFTDRTDPLYNVVTLVNWGLVEQNVVIVAACIPTLRPFFHLAFKGETKTSSSWSTTRQTGKSFQSRSKKSAMSLSETQLDDIERQGDDSVSKQAIWRSVDVTMEWDRETRNSRATPSDAPAASVENS